MGHLDVGDNQVGDLHWSEGQALQTVITDYDFIAVSFEDKRDQIDRLGVVINDQDLRFQWQTPEAGELRPSGIIS